MRQKATWFIPGILLTLLLGLLWAMPAFAVDAGDIAFNDTKGKAITHVSLNGPASEIANGFRIEITDADLNKEETIREAGTGPLTSDPNVFNMVDLDGDGERDIDDVKFYLLEAGDPAATPPTEDIYHYRDVELGELDIDIGTGTIAAWTLPSDIDYTDRTGTAVEDAAATGIEFKAYVIETIGARAGVTRTGSWENTAPIRGDANTISTPVTTATAPGDPATLLNMSLPSALVDDDDTPGVDIVADTWTEVVNSMIPDLLTRPIVADDANTATTTTQAEMTADITKLFKAYNMGAPAKPLNVAVTVAFGGTDGAVTAVNSITVDNADPAGALEADANVDKDTVCVGLNQKATPDRPSSGTGSTGDIPAADYDCDLTDTDTAGVVVYEEANLVVEVEYNGTAQTVFSKTQRIGDAGDVNRIMVDSDAVGTPISVMLKETSATTGVFRATVVIEDCAEDATCDAKQAGETALAADADIAGMITLPVYGDGDTIVVTYSDADPSATRTATIPLDPDGPSFSNVSPASGSAGREDEPTVSFDILDGASGISSSKDAGHSVFVFAKLYNIDGKTAIATANTNELVIQRKDLKVDSIIDGYSASVTLEEGTDTDELDPGTSNEYLIHWWALGTDQAGNTGASDQNTKADSECVPEALNEASITATDLLDANCDPFVIRVDAKSPTFNSAKTGVWHDGDNEQPYEGDDADVTKKAAKTTSVVARFSEALDCDSVAVDDFTVGGSAPNGVTCVGANVYLDVDELDTDAKPSVVVATGSVTDKAGNAIAGDDASRTKTSSDGISAVLTVSVTGTGEGDRPLTKDKVTITISSDERLKGNPTVTINMVEGDYGLSSSTVGCSPGSTGVTNEWSCETAAITADGVYNVQVTGEDRGSGVDTTKGASSLSKDGFDTSGAILFEVDTEVQRPAFKPETSTVDAGAFVRADFEDEGMEYGLAAMCQKAEMDDVAPNEDGSCETGYTKNNKAAATETPADVATDFDTSGTVELVSASFNGDDVTDDVITRDDVLFVYRPGSLTNGDHTFKIKVMDVAGNEGEFTHEFSKRDRPAYKIELNPGPNLISFPADPADGDVNAVFSNEDIMSVLTFDNATGLWQTATRTGGALSGDLTTVNGMNGYWVVSDGVVDVSVVLSAGTDFQPPPHIAVQEGWNLIGVVDADQAPAGGEIMAKDYFANIDAEVVYGYDSLEGKLVRLSVGDSSTDVVKTGAAYWVYANEAGIIVP